MKMLLFICGIADKIDGGLRKEEKYAEKKRFYFVWLSSCVNSDFDQIDHLLRTCDYLVVASPVYNLSFPAPLKAIFDRTQRYFSARFVRGERPPIAKHKKAAMLLTCGADSRDGADIIRKQLKMIFTVLNTELAGEVLWKNTDRDKNMEPLMGVLAETAEKLAIAWDL